MYERFVKLMQGAQFASLFHEDAIAIAVSGGADSMALAHLLSRWSFEHKGPQLYVFAVDHGLRAESAREADFVCQTTAEWKNIKAQSLSWDGVKPETKLQEEARHARYEILQQVCIKEGIRYVCLGHHQDDQAETFLFRLAKGSGLDGLSCMRACQERGAIVLMRPILDFSKVDILNYCEVNSIPFINDPSNNKEEFARVRLRKSMMVLEAEGLSAKRLNTTAKRMRRASEALDIWVEDILKNKDFYINTKRVEIDLEFYLQLPEEIRLRLIIKLMGMIKDKAKSDTKGYGPRMERLESLAHALASESSFRTRTLGGIIFKVEKAQIILQEER